MKLPNFLGKQRLTTGDKNLITQKVVKTSGSL